MEPGQKWPGFSLRYARTVSGFSALGPRRMRIRAPCYGPARSPLLAGLFFAFRWPFSLKGREQRTIRHSVSLPFQIGSKVCYTRRTLANSVRSYGHR